MKSFSVAKAAPRSCGCVDSGVILRDEQRWRVRTDTRRLLDETLPFVFERPHFPRDDGLFTPIEEGCMAEVGLDDHRLPIAVSM